MLKTLNEINFNKNFAMLSNEINKIEININLIMKRNFSKNNESNKFKLL